MSRVVYPKLLLINRFAQVWKMKNKKQFCISSSCTFSRRKRSRSRGSIEEEILAPPSEPSVSDTLSRINLNLSVVPEESEIPMMTTPFPVISKVSQAENRFIRYQIGVIEFEFLNIACYRQGVQINQKEITLYLKHFLIFPP